MEPPRGRRPPNAGASAQELSIDSADGPIDFSAAHYVQFGKRLIT
jgi:hypothetical protein